jgi:IrrE N-terminal-like domain
VSSSRAAKGLLPPNPKQWDNERRGLALREELRLGLDCILEPEIAFETLPRTYVYGHGALIATGTPIDFVSHFRGAGLRSWSGAAFPTPDGAYCILYNDAHPRTRIRATLMEEFFHLRLGHPATKLRVLNGEPSRRTFHAGIEAEAYGSGAAALVPYKTLKALHQVGEDENGIGAAFGVSAALARYRLNVTRLNRRRKA